MARVTKSTKILHKFNIDSKVDSWDGLIFAAESELERISERGTKLREAIRVFKRKKLAGDPLVQAVDNLSAI